MGYKIDRFNQRTQEQIRKQLVPPQSKGIGMFELAKEHKRIRQSQKPLLNKLEQECLEWLRLRYDDADIFKQAIRFMLANGHWYKPDFVTWDEHCTIGWEVKGPFAHRGGFENLKVAAHQYRRMCWVLLWKEKGEWQQQSVLP